MPDCSRDGCDRQSAYLLASIGDACAPHAFDAEPETVRFLRHCMGRPPAAEGQPDPLAGGGAGA